MVEGGSTAGGGGAFVWADDDMTKGCRKEEEEGKKGSEASKRYNQRCVSFVGETESAGQVRATGLAGA